MTGLCLSLSQQFLILYTKVCALLMDKLSRTTLGELVAKIGLDASNKHVFDWCVSHWSSGYDLHGTCVFKLADVSVILECEQMMLGHPMQFTVLWTDARNVTILCTRKGWDAITHMN